MGTIPENAEVFRKGLKPMNFLSLGVLNYRRLVEKFDKAQKGSQKFYAYLAYSINILTSIPKIPTETSYRVIQPAVVTKMKTKMRRVIICC